MEVSECQQRAAATAAQRRCPEQGGGRVAAGLPLGEWVHFTDQLTHILIYIYLKYMQSILMKLVVYETPVATFTSTASLALAS